VIVPIIQARMGASRFPGKVLAPMGDGRPMLAHVVERTRDAFPEAEITIAMPARDATSILGLWGVRLGCRVVGADEDDVLTRFLFAVVAQPGNATVVRVTADDPMKVPELMRVAANEVPRYTVGHCVDTNHGRLAGLGAEAFTVETLRQAHGCTHGEDRQHVTGAMYHVYPEVALTVDTVDDWKRLCA
jgi:spore coat polysaccharide biosynthesis protein SpsF (cytidylyltransferase family)